MIFTARIYLSQFLETLGWLAAAGQIIESMKWLTGLGIVLGIAGGYFLYWVIHEHIDASAHSNPLRREFYFYLVVTGVLTSFSLWLLWPRAKWFAIPLVLVLQAVAVVAMISKFFLPFP